jgi:hypothetical protein
MKKKIAITISVIISLAILYLLIHKYVPLIGELSIFPGSKEEFTIQGLTWRTTSYYYYPGIYKEIYSPEKNLNLIKKAKNIGANYLLIRAFYNGTADGDLVGNDKEAEAALSEAISTAHDYRLKILLTPYVESIRYVDGEWKLSEEVWTETVLRWAKFAKDNGVEMFAPGVEMNSIMENNKAGEWFKIILPEIRKIYNGKIITAEKFDAKKWEILDDEGAFAGYDCIGLTVFPRWEYDGISDIRSLDDYKNYLEIEAKKMDDLSKKYEIKCKLAVPIGLNYWQGNAAPEANIVAEVTNVGLDILKKHNITGVFISRWASEPDQFGDKIDVEKMLQRRWTK